MRKAFIISFLFFMVTFVPIFYLQAQCDPSKSLCNPAGSEKNLEIEDVAGQVIKYILEATGTIALLIFIYAGFTSMWAQGSGEKIKKSYSMMVWAILGLMVIFASYALVNWVLVEISF